MTRIMDFCIFCNASNVFEDGKCIVCNMTRREFPAKKAVDGDKMGDFIACVGKLKPRGFGFDKASMDMGYEMCKEDVLSKLGGTK